MIGEDLLREVRRGQRTALLVDLDVPEAPGQQLTVVSTHLENRAKPKIRREHMEELLQQIHDIFPSRDCGWRYEHDKFRCDADER